MSKGELRFRFKFDDVLRGMPVDEVDGTLIPLLQSPSSPEADQLRARIESHTASGEWDDALSLNRAEFGLLWRRTKDADLSPRSSLAHLRTILSTMADDGAIE
jgi:hypothetical protein